jgi:hypothetical protein
MFLPVLWKHDHRKIIGKLLYDIITHKNLIVFEPYTVTLEMLQLSDTGLAYRILENNEIIDEKFGNIIYVNKIEVLEISL